MLTPKPAAVELRDVPASDIWKTINLASKLISDKVGLIQGINHGIFRAQDPQTIAMGAGVQDLSTFSEILNSSKAGGGGERVELALAATIGEAVERYCMNFYDKEKLVFASYREVQNDAVHPDLVRYYSREQIATARFKNTKYFSEDSKIHWEWGYSLTFKRHRLVPATQVYLNYNLDDHEENPGRNASTGLAAGASLEEAILSGLFEVVERDAVAILWHHRKIGPRIRIDNTELIEMLEDRFHIDHPSVDVKIFDIRLDIPIPSVFAVMQRPSEFGPILCVSSVTRLDPKEAVRKSMREMGQATPYMRYLYHQLDDWEPASDFSNITTFDHHFMLYSKRPELIPEAMGFCDNVEDEILLSEIPDYATGRVLSDIEYCVNALRELGFEVIVSDITTPEISDLGLHTVRVLIPGLVPLHGNHNYPYLGLKRLHEIPRKLEWQESGWDTESGLNSYPHPFP